MNFSGQILHLWYFASQAKTYLSLLRQLKSINRSDPFPDRLKSTITEFADGAIEVVQTLTESQELERFLGCPPQPWLVTLVQHLEEARSCASGLADPSSDDGVLGRAEEAEKQLSSMTGHLSAIARLTEESLTAPSTQAVGTKENQVWEADAAFRVIALIMQAEKEGREWTKKEIAAKAGCDREIFRRNDLVKAAVNGITGLNAAKLPRGRKNKEGVIEATDEE